MNSVIAQLRWVTRSLREPEGLLFDRLRFFQDGLTRALQAIALSYGLLRAFVSWASGPVFSRPFR